MPDCVALAIHTPARRHRPHRRLQDRSDADRRPALRRAPLRASSAPTGVLALFADSTNIDRRGFTGSETRGRRRVRGDLHERDRAAGRRGVRVEHLPDADPRRPGGAVRSQGRVRRPRHDRELGDRAAARLSADSRRACRFATPTSTSYPAQDVLCLATGSQGEPLSALSRIAIDDHRYVKLAAGRHGGASRPARSPATKRRSAAS